MGCGMNYWPEVSQALPTPEHKVYLYFDDGTIRLFDAEPLLDTGAFRVLCGGNLFVDACTVLNHTLAWTPDMSYDETTCLDLDPSVLYATCPIVEEPKERFKSFGRN
jgi:hypothetical protein